MGYQASSGAAVARVSETATTMSCLWPETCAAQHFRDANLTPPIPRFSNELEVFIDPSAEADVWPSPCIP
jgi:hypothetical protein